MNNSALPFCRDPRTVMENYKIKEEQSDNVVVHEINELAESHAEFENLNLMCTESLGTEEQFHSNENASSLDMSKPGDCSSIKSSSSNSKQQLPQFRRVNKQPLPSNFAAVSIRDKGAKKSSRTTTADRQRQSRSRRSMEEPIIREVTVVDEQSVVPLSDVAGDLSFDDLELEDLDLVQHLPPPGNVNIIDRCGSSHRSLREFERKLQDVLHRETREASQTMPTPTLMPRSVS